MRLSAQQRAVLNALYEQSPLPTTVLRDVRVRNGDAFANAPRPDSTYRIGEPVGSVLRRLKRRGLVTAERGRDCNDWWISDAGAYALEALAEARINCRRIGAL